MDRTILDLTYLCCNAARFACRRARALMNRRRPRASNLSPSPFCERSRARNSRRQRLNPFTREPERGARPGLQIIAVHFNASSFKRRSARRFVDTDRLIAPV